MADVFTRKKRSEIMSRIRSKGTVPEKILHSYLKSLHIRHKMHPDLPGKPDALIKESHCVIFIDGCFWHACRNHFRMPKSHRPYWAKKIRANRARDRRVSADLSASGWSVIRIWEHEFKKPYSGWRKLVMAASHNRH